MTLSSSRPAGLSNAAVLRLSAVVLLAALFAGCQPTSNEVSKRQVAREVAAARERLEANDGGRLVLQAIEAHGGLEAWYAAPTSSYTWDYSNPGMKLRFKSRLVADNRTRQIYHTLLTLGTPEEPLPVTGRFAWTGEEAWIAPASITQVNPRFWAATGYYFQSIPFVLADPGLRYEALPDEQLDGKTYRMVRVGFEAGVGDAPDDTYTLYLDPESHRVAALRYTVTFGRSPQATAGARPETLFYYEDYVTVDGLTVPRRFRGFNWVDGKAGTFKNEAWADEISFRRPFDASQLVMPADGKVVPKP